MRFVFYGRTQVGAILLSHLVALGHNCVAVIPEDELLCSLAERYDTDILPLSNLNTVHFDYFFCSNGKRIIPERYLVKGKFINFHPCLSKYKGVDPIGRYMVNKDTNASVESHYMIKQVDAGKKISKVSFKTPIIQSYGEFYNLAIPHYYQCLSETLERIL